MPDTISHLPFGKTRWGVLSYDFRSGEMHISLPETSGSIGGELWLNHAQADQLHTMLANALQDVRVSNNHEGEL